MTHLYKRSGGRAPVYWEPEDDARGKEAIRNVLGSTPGSYPVEVDGETAARIRQEYADLTGGTN